MEVSAAIGMLGIKSLVECLLYSQPFVLRTDKRIEDAECVK